LSNPPSLLVCAAEISADVRGARLAAEIARLAPGVRLYGLGGQHMARAGVDVRVDITDLGTVGWFDHWPHLARYLEAWRFWRREVRAGRPRAAIVIDAPGISFPFARIARSAGVPVAYFIAPQTWLWNPRSAVTRLRGRFDLVIATLAEEADIYARAGLPVVYEGHPALDDLLDAWNPGDAVATGRGHPSDAGSRGRDAHPPVVGLVPGSRRHAIRRLLPVMLDALDLVERQVGVRRTLLSVAAPSLRAEVDACLRGRPRVPEIVEQDLRAVLKASDLVLASAGGNLLEAAFADVPVVACYRIDPVSYWFAQHVLHVDAVVPAYTLPNIIAGGRVLPELIQADFTPGRMADAAVRLLSDEAARDALRETYRRVRERLGTAGVTTRIAAALVARLGLGTPEGAAGR
jgi:lipid-A-disaccharide synthase